MPPAVPLATYRLQLTGDFGFTDAAAIVPYLKSLGITHVYASPFMRARSGSTHGYDVVDHTAFNPELGGAAGFATLSAALKVHDLGLILDFVPNHMGVHYADNAWWLDVLEWGPKSPFAAAFDIDWDMLPHRRKPGLLLPILGSAYGEALEKGEIELRYDPQTGEFAAHYFEHKLPIAPERYSEILRTIVNAASAAEGSAGRALLELAKKYSGLRNPDRRAAPDLKQRLATIDGAAALIAHSLPAYQAKDGTAQTLALHHLLERQRYRLSHWRLATSEINYRRFFDVNSLAGLRMEDRATFERVHTLVRRLIAEDQIQGLRIDHIDGLHDPAHYLRRLRRLIREAQGPSPRRFYLVVEKILGEDESLAPFSGCDGTTGYEWLNLISQVLVEPQGLAELDEVWRQASNLTPRFVPVLIESKRRVLETLLASEFTVLTRLLARVAAGHYTTRDYSEDSLRQALVLFVIHFPVYRTYITSNGPSAADRALINGTIKHARADWFAADSGIFDFVRDALTLDLLTPGRAVHSNVRVRRFAFKMQQFTGPLMAKSLEDTAFYRYPRLLALNEVGGDAAAAACPVDIFHAKLVQRANHWPDGMTATATHDTKRGEDARMRILALAELAGDWANIVGKWKTLNARFVTTTGDWRSPTIVDEYMLYQALLGATPLDAEEPDFTERFQQYAQKAIREAKTATSWLNPNEDYENGVRGFIANLLDPSLSREFIASLREFAKRTALIGALNSLSQLTLKTMMPGVPDFYQGTEFWDFSLVDPDNRRPVNFSERARVLHQAVDAKRRPDQEWHNGHIKLSLTRQLLTLRQQYPDVCANGDYVPLTATGEDARHVIAFMRRYRKRSLTVVALRYFAPFTQDGAHWPDFEGLDARIPHGANGTVRVGPLLRNFPAGAFTEDDLQASANRLRVPSLA